MPLATFLLSLVGPLLGRILAALGMSVVTIVGLDITIGQLKTMLVSAAGGMASEVLQLFLMAGGGSAVGIILGAINVRVTLWMIQRAVSIVGTPSS